jgi:hypothetical protein
MGPLINREWHLGFIINMVYAELMEWGIGFLPYAPVTTGNGKDGLFWQCMMDFLA